MREIKGKKMNNDDEKILNAIEDFLIFVRRMGIIEARTIEDELPNALPNGEGSFSTLFKVINKGSYIQKIKN